MYHKITLLFFSIISLSGFAQTPLPYYTGFDNTSEKSGWVEFRKGITTSYNWTYASFGGFSPPNILHHDYPVGAAATDTTVDWFVSPVFNFSSGGKLDSIKVTVYSITGSSMTVDRLEIYQLQGSNNPSLATQVKLATLTGMVSSSFAWRDTGNFTITPFAGNSYIAFKYQATQNWFVISIDNIKISGSAIGINSINAKTDIYKIYPNPSPGEFRLDLAEQIEIPSKVMVYDITGILLKEIQFNPGAYYNLDLADGVYFVGVLSKDQLLQKPTKLLIKN